MTRNLVWALGAALALHPVATAQSTTTQIRQHGITWTFAQPVQAGQFANGDWWVLAPATVQSVWPAPGGGRNGSMLNPRAGDVGRQQGQGYDDRIQLHRPAAAVSFPRTLAAGDVLVSTESRGGARQPGIYRGVESQAFLKSAAILTAVATTPPADAFRPPYCGPRVVYRTRDIRWNVLPRLLRVGSLDPISFARHFERPWIDHLNGWESRGMHPYENMPDYGREIALCTGEGGLLLLQDWSAAELTPLLVRYLQLGIDLYGLVRDGHQWWGDGGHLIGRKWPIVFAGLVLGDAAMARPGNGFSEDVQTYFATGWTGDHATFRMRSSDRHEERDPTTWSSTEVGYEQYRHCCTSFAWVGAALCAIILDARAHWDHAPFFHYVERWMTPMLPGDRALSRQITGPNVDWFPHGHTGSDLVTRMWDAYRARFEPAGVERIAGASRSEVRLSVFDPVVAGAPLALWVDNAPAQAGILVAGLRTAPMWLGQAALVVQPSSISLPIAADRHGHARLALPIPMATGRTVRAAVQAVWLDAARSAADTSQAFELTLR
jgi:hypothetical protein